MHATSRIPARRIARAAVRAALAAIVLPIAAACGGDSATGPGRNTPRTETPSVLVGTWVFGLISPTDMYDAYNGQWVDNAYGTAVIWTMTGDGRYTQDILIKTSAYSCRMQVFVHNEGTSVIDDGTIRVYPTKGRVIARDTCNAKNNYDRADDIARKQGTVYTWAFEENEYDGKTYLMVGWPGETARSSFRRVE